MLTSANPMIQLAASSDDDPCAGTGNTCNEATWHSQRRTARLANAALWFRTGDRDWNVGFRCAYEP